MAAAEGAGGRGANVQVAVRLRPFLPRERGQTQAAWVQNATTVKVKVLTAQLAAPPKEEEKVFSFDHCFSSVDKSAGGVAVADQQQVYDTIGKEFLLGSALAGYNSCLFAYGQTGSGKTHTVLGHERDPGIVPRLTAEMFERGQAEYPEMRVSASFLEIYNEQLKDLLNPDLKRRKPLYVHQHPKLGVYVPHLTEEAVMSHEECMSLLDFGNRIRATSQTNMNSTSSRSHALFILRLTCPITDGQLQRIRCSTLNLIDLAGSERVKKSGAAGQRMREGQNINSSLSVLGQVISKLADGKSRQSKHVPFRQSKLTYLLTDALSGNSRTLMVAAISPALSESDETLGTLRFASSVKKIKTVAVKNEQEVRENDLMLQTMRSEVEDLRKAARHVAAESEDARRLQSKAEAMEAAVLSMQTRIDPRRWQEAHQKQVDRRRELMQTLSMPLALGAVLNENSGADKVTDGVAAHSPYLLNISDDISLAGRLLYFLPEGPAISVGSHEENRIRLLGLGIVERLCELSVSPGGSGVEVRYLCRGGRLVVDGQVVSDGQPRPVRHGAKLVFGRAFAFRAVIPKLAPGSLGPEDLVPTTELGGISEDAAPAKEGDPITMLLDTVPSASVDADERNELMRQARSVQDDVDEANELLREMEQPQQQFVEVSLVLRPPQLVDPAQPSSGRQARAPRVVVNCYKIEEGGDSDLVAVWPLTRFYTHLEELRDKYQQLCDRQREGRPVDCVFGCTIAWGAQAVAEEDDAEEEGAGGGEN